MLASPADHASRAGAHDDLQVRVLEARNLSPPDRLSSEGATCDLSIEIKFAGNEQVRAQGDSGGDSPRRSGPISRRRLSSS
jgi:hypothetical protein